MSKITVILAAIICMASLLVTGAETQSQSTGEPITAPSPTPKIQVLAEFMSNTRCPVYEMGEQVSLWVAVDGRRTQPDSLQWSVNDYNGNVIDKGELEVPHGISRWSSILKLKDAGAGYFEVKIGLRGSGDSILQYGSRPAGLVAYGVLPAIERLPLAHPDDSRFGAQGTNFIASGELMKGGYVDPVYPLLGAKWIYINRHIGELFLKGEDSYKPELNPKNFYQTCESKAGLSLLVDLHGIPPWLWKVPEGSVPPAFDNTRTGQQFAPKDFGIYKKLVARLVTEQVARRDALFPDQANNYYQLHWEPDWHWKGSDEDFIMMYKVAREAIRENDPKGLLLGPNYGVLRTGNALLKRLFAKGLGKYLDGILTHIYVVALANDDASRQSLVDDMRELVSMTRTYLPSGARIINTEWGVDWRKPPSVDPDALRTEAADFMRGHLITLGEGADCTFYFYTADHSSNSGCGLLYNLTLPNPTFGATHVAPKPIFMAAAMATRLLEGTKSLGAIEYLDPGVLGYAFDRKGERILCLWTKNEKKMRIRMPSGNLRTISVLDPMGNAKEHACRDGMADMEVGAIPIWLRGIDPVSLPFDGKADQLKAFPGESLRLDAVAGKIKLRLFTDGAWIDAGEAGKLDVPVNASEGRKLVGVFNAETGVLVSTRLLDVKPSIAAAPSQELIPGALAFDVSNRRPADISGTLSLSVDGKAYAGKSLTLSQGMSTKVSFDLRKDGVALPKTGKPSLVFKDTNGAECSFPAPLPKPVIQARRLVNAPPKIDGNLNDWLLELFNAASDKANPELSAAMALRVGVQYDVNNLYLGFKVYDRSHVQTRHPSGLWMQDSIQIGLAVHPDGTGWKTWQKLDFGLNSVMGAQNGCREMGNAFPEGILKQGEISWGIVHQGDETFYEISIPWSQIEKGLSSPPSEGILGFGVLLNNVDIDRATGMETPRKYIDVFGGMGWSKPEDFGIIDLK
ncbi:MAG: hypothetical protein WAX69_23125 [Victivallales bacterium]